MELINLIKGERSMSKSFIAQYAAEATLRTQGVAYLEHSGISHLKQALGFEHEGQGVVVDFSEADTNLITITVYPIIYFGEIVPEVSWRIQERVKTDVEDYTGLICEAVNVHVKNIVLKQDSINSSLVSTQMPANGKIEVKSNIFTENEVDNA